MAQGKWIVLGRHHTITMSTIPSRQKQDGAKRSRLGHHLTAHHRPRRWCSRMVKNVTTVQVPSRTRQAGARAEQAVAASLQA